MSENDDIEWEEVFFDGDAFVDEQRGNERHGVRVPVLFIHNAQECRGFSSDLSHGGMFVASETLVPSGTKLAIDFKLPNAESSIQTAARVRWSREEPGDEPDEPRGFGIEFLELDERERAAIDQFIELRETLLFDFD